MRPANRKDAPGHPSTQVPRGDSFSMRRITIVGGGASGTLVAINLARLSTKQNPVQINLVEQHKYICRGVAYSSDKPFHLLNVPAGKIGAFPEAPDHFLHWLHSKGFTADEHSFVPRGLYGDYLRDLFEKETTSALYGKIRVFSDTASDVLIEKNVSLSLHSGSSIESDYLVLAFGNFPPPHPSVPDQSFTASPRYIRNIWQESSLCNIAPDNTVLILGTGLSMVDVVLSLKHSGHKGKIIATSTRALIPAEHALPGLCNDFAGEVLSISSIRQLLQIIRREIKIAEASGGNWRAVIDYLRPYTQRIWQSLPEREKRRFAVHLSRWWNIARHRMPPSAAKDIESLQQRGQFEIIAGRIREITNENNRFTIRLHSNNASVNLKADVIINCIASESRYSRIESEFLQNLFARGLVREGPLGFGFDALPNGAILDKNGLCGMKLFTLGTALKGVLWETTAIPEIRTQASELARLLLS